MPPSYAGKNWLGKSKVVALAEKIQYETGSSAIIPIERNYTGQRESADVVIVTVDSMEARRRIWANRERINGWNLWIDARMGKDQAGVYCVRNEQDIPWYEGSLAREGAQLVCGEKATASICGGYVPGMVGTMIMRYIRDLPMPRSMFVKVLLEPQPFFSVDMGDE